MDEWTGRPYDDQIERVFAALSRGVSAIRDLLDLLSKITS